MNDRSQVLPGENAVYGRIPLPNSDGILLRQIQMPSIIAPWLPNALLEEARRRGAQAGDPVRGTYRRTDGEMVFDPASVEVVKPTLSVDDDTVAQ